MSTPQYAPQGVGNRCAATWHLCSTEGVEILDRHSSFRRVLDKRQLRMLQGAFSVSPVVKTRSALYIPPMQKPWNIERSPTMLVERDRRLDRPGDWSLAWSDIRVIGHVVLAVLLVWMVIACLGWLLLDLLTAVYL